MKIIYTIFSAMICIVLAFTFSSYSGGATNPGGNGYSGAPDETFTCGGCHNNGIFGTPVVTVVVSRLGSPVTEYVPNTVYDVTVTVTAAMGTPVGYGFQLVALNTTSGNAGAFSNPSANTEIVTGSSGRNYAQQNTRSSSNTFSFEWTANGGLTGDATIYAVGNTVNGAGGTNGDNGSPSATVVVLPEAALPITFISFEGTKTGLQTQLNWEAEEEGIQNYIVTRSIDGLYFYEIGRVEATGNSAYSFVDERPLPGNNYYRLRTNEVNGQNGFSPVVTVKGHKLNDDISIFPNPAIGTANLAFDLAEGDYSMTIYNSIGQVMKSKNLTLGLGMNAASINTEDWSTGIYVVEMKGKGQVATARFIKQ